VHRADTAGWLGALVLVVAYATSSANRLPASGRTYQTMNLLGSVGLGAVAAAHHTWPSFALNAVWLAVAAAALTRSDAHRSPQPADTRN
jgi:hypothetical protein